MILNIISNKINFKTKKHVFSKKCLTFKISVMFYTVNLLLMGAGQQGMKCMLFLKNERRLGITA